MSDTHSVSHTQTTTKKSWWEAIKAYRDPRAMIMLFLGFAAGIPILLIFSSLSLWLREAGIDRSVVTMFSWAALAYSFKFIWAPLIDALPLPILTKWLGRRRGWMLVAQILIIAAICLMASVNPTNERMVIFMAFAAVLLGFSSATQDIVIDAYRIELAPPSLQTVLSAMYSGGYRLGMIVAGAGALYLADYFGSNETFYSYEAWRNTYYIMAAVMSIGILTTFASYEPTAEILQLKKQQFNLKIFLIYASVLIIPTVIFGGLYLLNLLGSSIFGYEVLTLPAVMLDALKTFYLTLLVIAPVLLLFFIIRQPKIINKAPLVAKTNSDYVRLVALFLVSVVAFILMYVGYGQVIPEIEEVMIKFLSEAGRLSLSLAAALLTGYVLVHMGLVSKKLAVATWIEPIIDFFNRYGKKALLLLALIGLYRISDIVAGVISNVFYQDMGFSKTDIATAVKLVGVIMVIGGGFLGGILAQKLRLMQAMMIGAILAGITNLLFVLLTYHPGDLSYMYFAVIFDNLAAGLASAVFIAFLSALTSIRFTAVQYAIFSSLMTLLPKVLGGYSGTIVDNMGYPFFFVFTFLIGVPILWLIYLVDKKIIIGENDDTGEPPVLSKE